MDEHGHNVIAHSVKPKNEGKYRRKKRLTILGYVLFSLVYIGAVTLPVQLYPVLAGLPFFLYALYRITWWRLDYDLDYTLAHGELKVEKTWSASRRAVIACVSVKDAEAVTPLYNVTLTPAMNVLDVRGSAKAENSYVILYRSPEGKESALVFEATAKMVKMMSRFNPTTVVIEGLPL